VTIARVIPQLTAAASRLKYSVSVLVRCSLL